MESSISLFPQSPQTSLINREMKLKTLQLMNFFVCEIINTIIAFYFENRFHEFDPHVGDTLCQIRAYKNLLLILDKNKESFDQIKHELNRFKSISDQLKNSINEFTSLNNRKSEYHKNLDCNEKLLEFLNRNNLLFNIPKNILFLVQSRILTIFSKVDVNGISRGINYDELCYQEKITKNFAKRLMHYFQQNLSKLSCDFIFELLNDLDKFRELKLILRHLIMVDSDKRSVLPCYEVTKILLAHILKYRRAILILVEQECNFETKIYPFLFVPKEDGSDFELRQGLLYSYSNVPCFVIQGVTLTSTIPILVHRFAKLGLTKVLLANMAMHPQYSAMEFESISDNPYHVLLTRDFRAQLHIVSRLEKELLSMKWLGEQEGCCLENPTLFSIKHILCDTLEHQMVNSKNRNYVKQIIKIPDYNLDNNIIRQVTALPSIELI